MLINILLFLTVLTFLWITWRKRRLSIFSRNGIVGPKPNFWTGNYQELLQKRELFCYDYTNKYGNIFGYFIGAHPVLNVTDPELIKIIQVKEFRNFSNRNLVLPNIGIPHPVVSESISIVKDEEWKTMRTILSPSFSTGKMKKISLIIDDSVKEFLEVVKQKSKNVEGFDIYLHYQKFSLDVISKSAFGISTGVQHDENSLFLESMEIVFGADLSNILASLSICLPELEPIPTKLVQLVDAIKSYLGYPSVGIIMKDCEQVIEQRRKGENQKRNDLLQSMIDGKVESKKLSAIKYEDLTASGETMNEETKISNADPSVIKLSSDNIKANALVFMAAGYETTSSTVGLATYLLSLHQEIQEKLRKEIMTVMGEKENIEYDDLAKFQYLDQVLCETLRLYPVNSFTISRETKSKFKYNGITIPKGVIVAVPVWTLHRNPDFWANPDKFVPERFSPENRDCINATVYQPFGNGPRNCIGMRFAQTAMKFVLARLLQSYRLEYCSDEVFKYRHTLLLTHPVKVMVKAYPINRNLST